MQKQKNKPVHRKGCEQQDSSEWKLLHDTLYPMNNFS